MKKKTFQLIRDTIKDENGDAPNPDNLLKDNVVIDHDPAKIYDADGRLLRWQFQ